MAFFDRPDGFDKLADFTPSNAENPVQRLDQMHEWLGARLSGRRFEISTASADASFRRYFRLRMADDGQRFIVMDAPPDKEDCRPWIAIARLFAQGEVHVPKIFAEDANLGFILMSDLGDTTYLQALTQDNAAALYADALGSLIAIQKLSRPGVLPDYSRELLTREMRLFDEWYVGHHKATSLDDNERAGLETVYDRILSVNLAEPQVFVHRDYHSRNLMHLSEGPNPGIIDFQDAVFGPISYDLASLFKDAYIRWEEDFVLDLLIRYWETARSLGLPVRADFADFLRDYDWMGVQRHLKVLGIFARLNHRDGKPAYLDDMPVVLEHLRRTCRRYRDLSPLLRLLDRLDPEETSVGYTF